METPSSRLIAAAREEFSTIDRAGRTLLLRRMDALDRLRLFKALGPALSVNTPYLGMALIAASVSSIDGVPVPPPITEDQLEALIRRLGDDGLAALADALDAADQVGDDRADVGN
jgi:phosphate uptake regulator